jgi:hypothetical protein
MSRLYLDTNVLWSGPLLKELSRRARSAGHRVVVPALVHAERLAQMRRERGPRFSIAAVNAFLETHEISVEPFDLAEAERASSVLASVFPTKDDWHGAKNEALKGRTPATTDFFIGAPLADSKHPFVSEDRGHEFRSMGVRRITYEEAIAMFPEDPS